MECCCRVLYVQRNSRAIRNEFGLLRVSVFAWIGFPFGGHRFLGRPPFLPHWESLFLCLCAVIFPPFFPMHLGQTILVRGCTGQCIGLGTP